MLKRQVTYFEQFGSDNTDAVVDAVVERLQVGDIKTLLVASTSGATALRFAKRLNGKVHIVCVSESPGRREWGSKWPCLKPSIKKELEKLGVSIMEMVPYVFHNSIMENSRWGGFYPERIVKETLYCFGQGMKVAVELALSAVACGYVEPFTDVLSVGGTSSGSDTAIVLRATYPACIFDKDPAKRLEIREVIALPLAKKWWD